MDRLFSLDFDNYSTNVSYLLDGTNELVATGVSFTPGSELHAARHDELRCQSLERHAQQRRCSPRTGRSPPLAQPWTSATLTPSGSFTTPAHRAITTCSSTITASPPRRYRDSRKWNSSVAPLKGWTLLRVFGPDGSRWAVEGTTNLLNWTALKTNVVSGSYFDMVDMTAAGLNQRLYRARLVP